MTKRYDWIVTCMVINEPCAGITCAGACVGAKVGCLNCEHSKTIVTPSQNSIPYQKKKGVK